MLKGKIVALVEDAIHRLEPNEDTSGRGGLTEDAFEDAFVSVRGAISAIGAELRDRISHALAERSLQELVEPHRTDMSGLQVSDTNKPISSFCLLPRCWCFVK